MVWSPHTKRNINNLEQVQRRATRFILGRDYSENERLSKLNLLPLKSRREINDLGPVPERRNNSIPGIKVPYFRDNFIPGINSVPEKME